MVRTKLGELTWTDLQAKDLETQSAFYEALFGWTHEDLPTGENTPPYRMFSKDGKLAAGGNPMSPDMLAQGAPSFWAIYLGTPDLDATLAKALDAGATVIMPPMDVLESGRMAAISDPTGGGIFLWQPRGHKGAEVFMQPGTIGWADLSTRDPQTATDFFANVFGYEIETVTEPGPYWQLKVDGEGVAGVMPIPDSMSDMRPVWTIYFAVETVADGVAKAQSLGAQVVSEPMGIGMEMGVAVLADPAGAVFALLGKV